jgi:hypothetical protein
VVGVVKWGDIVSVVGKREKIEGKSESERRQKGENVELVKIKLFQAKFIVKFA